MSEFVGQNEFVNRNIYSDLRGIHCNLFEKIVFCKVIFRKSQNLVSWCPKMSVVKNIYQKATNETVIICHEVEIK